MFESFFFVHSAVAMSSCQTGCSSQSPRAQAVVLVICCFNYLATKPKKKRVIQSKLYVLLLTLKAYPVPDPYSTSGTADQAKQDLAQARDIFLSRFEAKPVEQLNQILRMWR